MESHLSTTPFGRRTLTLAHVASQAVAKARPQEKAVHKWQVFHAICAAKARLGVSERALSVLNALLTFHPEIALSGEGLIVFPSNEQLSARAHGMAPATLRRHLAVLVDCGLIIRRDSPNGKRYARRSRSARSLRGPRNSPLWPTTFAPKNARLGSPASASRSAAATSPK
jgi:replication initiation protein RepC